MPFVDELQIESVGGRCRCAVESCDAAGPRHVLDDDARTKRLRQIGGDQSGVGVESAAGAIADEDADRLILEERGFYGVVCERWLRGRHCHRGNQAG